VSPQNKGTVASLMRQHYERILYPYDVFLSGATTGSEFGLFEKRVTHDDVKSGTNNSIKAEKDQNESSDVTKESEKSQSRNESEVKAESGEAKPETRQLRTSPRRLAQKSQARNSNIEPQLLKCEKVEITCDTSNISSIGTEQQEKQECSKQSEERSEPIQLRPSPRRLARRMQAQQRRTTFPRVDKELQRLQVYGAGPKMPGFSTDEPSSKSQEKSNKENSSKVYFIII